jgi:hypothetical protein
MPQGTNEGVSITMTKRSTLVVFVLLLLTTAIASAKSYYITLANNTMAGTQQLKPGQYEVSLKDTTLQRQIGRTDRKSRAKGQKIRTDFRRNVQRRYCEHAQSD